MKEQASDMRLYQSIAGVAVILIAFAMPRTAAGQALNKDGTVQLGPKTEQLILSVLRENGYNFIAREDKLVCYDAISYIMCRSRDENGPDFKVTIAMNPIRIGVQKGYSLGWADCFVPTPNGFLRSSNPDICGQR